MTRPLPTGEGRYTGRKTPVPPVESLPCPAGGTHRLANSAERGGLVTACLGCSASWSELDAQAREGRRVS